MERRATRLVCSITMLFLTGTVSAQVQPETAPLPWERDVSAEDKRLAEILFVQAVELHEQLLRDQAVTRYEEALSHWENPNIRWNLALLTKDLGQHLRAYEHLERALMWGPEAFNQENWQKLTAMRQMLLRRHLAVVEGLCDEPDAELSLDGKPWFRGPGTAHRVALPGKHVIMARKPGYFPVVRNIVLKVGTQGAVTVTMSVDRIFEKRRWASPTPSRVIRTGVVLGLAGTVLELLAQGERARAVDGLAGECGSDPACAPATPSGYRRARWEHRIAIGAMATGITMSATGLLLVLLNQPRSYRTEDRGGATLELVPMASPDAAGISARFRF